MCACISMLCVEQQKADIFASMIHTDSSKKWTQKITDQMSTKPRTIQTCSFFWQRMAVKIDRQKVFMPKKDRKTCWFLCSIHSRPIIMLRYRLLKCYFRSFDGVISLDGVQLCVNGTGMCLLANIFHSSKVNTIRIDNIWYGKSNNFYFFYFVGFIIMFK